MKHLTVDEIIDFVSFEKADTASLNLSLRVNEHIRICEKCRRIVNAFQTVYDEFTRLQKKGTFKKYVYSFVSENEMQSSQIQEIKQAFEESEEQR